MSASLSDLIKSRLGRNTPFVIYRKPGQEYFHLISQNNSTLNRLNNFSEAGFVMSPFSRDDQAIIIAPDEYIQFEIEPGTPGPVSQSQDISNKPEDEIKHKSIVAKAVGAIKSGSLIKVVLGRKIEFDLAETPISVFENLLAAHRNAFCYWWHHPSVGTWMGASPELFLSITDGELTTYSLAGTITAEDNEEPTWTEKEINEQQLVTDYILDKLSRFSTQIRTEGPESVMAGKLWHLKSTIRSSCDTSLLSEVINSLHPTPAVCGIPLEAAVRFIDAHEGFDRKFYTGFLGEINLGNSQDTELYVNLRCMEWQQQKATVYVGGGITVDSDPAAEWLETEAKSRTILNAVFKYEK